MADREVSFALIAKDSASKAFEKVSRAANSTRKDLDKFKRDNGNIEVNLKGDISDLETKLKRAKVKLETVPDVTKAKVVADISNLEAKILKAKKDLDDFERSGSKLRRMGTFVKGLTQSFLNLGKSLGGLKFFLITGAIGGFAAAVDLAAKAVQSYNAVGSVLSSGLGSVIALGVSAALAVTTLKIAFKGLGGALGNSGDAKAFADSLKKLDPAARSTAKSLAKIKEAAKVGVAKNTFKDLSGSIDKMGKKYAPLLNRELTRTATGFNKAARSTLDFLSQGKQVNKVNDLLKNSGSFTDSLFKSMRPLSGALLNFATAGSQALPGLGKGLEHVMTTFEAFSERVTKGGKNSDFANFITKIKDALTGLKSDAATSFFTKIKTGATAISDAMPTVIQAIKDLSPALGDIVAGAGGAFGTQLKLYATAAIALAPAINAVAAVLGPLGPAIGVVAVGLRAATVAMAALDAVMALNPFGLVVLAIAGLAIGLTALWKKSQTAREAMSTAFAGIATSVLTAATIMLSVYREVTTGVLNMVSTTLRALGQIPGNDWADRAADKVDGFKNDAESAFNGAISKANEWKTAADNLPKEIKIQGNIADLDSKIDDAKAKLNSKALTQPQKTKLKGDISGLEGKIATAKAKLRDKSLTDPQKTKLRAELNDLTAKVNTAKRKLQDNGLTHPQASKLRADISDLLAKKARAQASIDSLHGKTVTVRINTQRAVYGSAGGHYEGSTFVPSARAAGGPVASGQPYLVGERGPEIVVPGKSGTVLTASATSKLMKNAGDQGSAVSQGLAAGMFGNKQAVENASHYLASAITDKLQSDLQIASPSKVTKKYGKWVSHGLADGIRGGLSSVRSAVKKVNDVIDSKWGVKRLGHKKRAALHNMEGDLLNIAKQRGKIADKIKVRNDFSANVRAGVKSYGSLTATAGSSEHSTSNILADLRRKLKNAKNFAANLKKLRAWGLGNNGYRQLVEAGVEEGAETAAALVKGGRGAVVQVNSLLKQIDDTGKSLGKKAGNELYNAGRNAKTGIIKGLESKDNDLEKAANRIAKKFVKALKKALGIKSPSTVMAKQVGQFLPLGIIKGVESKQGQLDAVVARMVNPPNPNERNSGSIHGKWNTGNTVVVNVQVAGHALTTQDEISRIVVDAVNNTARRGTGKKILSKAVA